MTGLLRPAVRLLLAILLSIGFAWGGGGRKRVLTHADAAIILTKYSGFFDRYVNEDSGLNGCVAFLNKTGIYFGLMEIVNGSEFTITDCARAMGQIELVLSGNAELSLGKVKLPKGIESWEDFCTMSNVKYVEGYRRMLEMLNMAGVRKEE